MLVYWVQLLILYESMQTEKQKESKGLVKEEFQAVMQHLIVPVIKKDVRKRVAQGAETFSGKSMQEVENEWSATLKEASQCMLQQKWKCQITNQLEAARMQEERAAAKACEKIAAANEAEQKRAAVYALIQAGATSAEAIRKGLAMTVHEKKTRQEAREPLLTFV